ncbi:MAG: hypothetical protein SGILL_005337 [Bacillariaceae sp.]
MACRKAAYNALTEMSEYMERQQEHAAAARVKLEAEIKKTWTPSELLDQCCIPWIADGSEVVGHRTNHHVAKGCSGGCGKDHPRIMLDFISKSDTKSDSETTEGAVATLSHPLDPFVKYFEDLCQQHLATKIESKSSSNTLVRYSLKGFLQKNVEDLQKTGLFGYHLVKVSRTALASSKRAHERLAEEEEELERMAKRTKMDSGNKGGNRLLEQVLQICYNQGALLDHLDVLEISWMRLSGNKSMSRIAAKLAAERLRMTPLYLKAFLGHFDNGVPMENYPSRNDDDDDGDDDDNDLDSEPDSSPTIKLTFCESLGKLIPIESDLRLFWKRLLPQSLPDMRGRFVHMSLHIDVAKNGGREIPERYCLPKKNLEIGRYIFQEYESHEGNDSETSCELPSEQMPCSQLCMKVVTAPMQWSSLGPDPSEYTGSKCIVSGISVNLGFQHLLGIFARKKLPLAKKAMADIKQKRPVTRAEKEYVKAIAKAAREAPGSGERTFEGLEGW